MNIRQATRADAEQIAEIYDPYVRNTAISFETDPVTTEQMADRITEISAHGPYFVAEERGRILGYAYAHPWKERAAYSLTLETTVYVSPDEKGHGVGTALMARLIDDCRRRRFAVLIACITADNDASILFHQRLGFELVSHFHKVGFKLGRFHDVVDMELLL
ncbi:MAG: N-acetyltransferase family protein [Bacteroidales bacterium]|nr:N-acetyltransferase family protein [Bacteroidales bacterium]